jgi:hypothetical protein
MSEIADARGESRRTAGGRRPDRRAVGFSAGLQGFSQANAAHRASWRSPVGRIGGHEFHRGRRTVLTITLRILPTHNSHHIPRQFIRRERL